VQANDAPPEFVEAVKKAYADIDFRDGSLFEPFEQEAFRVVASGGRVVAGPRLGTACRGTGGRGMKSLWPQDAEDGKAMLRHICEAPRDDARRLVFADWLEEHGWPEQAEYVRGSVQPAGPPRGPKSPTRSTPGSKVCSAPTSTTGFGR
jgi:uncharacterized protein (TIGR02996 family)